MKHQINPFKYKETNIDWIGNIPSHWDYKKMKYLASIITGNTPPKSDEDNYRNGTYPWVKPDNLNKDYTISNTKEKLSEKGIELARIIPANSALVCSIGTVGKVAINKEPVTTNQQINSIIFDKENWLNQYGTYAVIAAESEFKKYSNKVVVSILNKTSQENIFMPLPKIYEQKIIGTFLDQKISEIDALIADKEKLITLLEEKRQATITEAVTKGLDSNVKMKSSGVEWIGEIPEHWETKKVKNISSIISSNVDKKTKDNEERVLLCNYVDVYYNDTIKPEYENFMVATANSDEINKFSIKDGDVIVTKDSESYEDIVVPSYIEGEFQQVVCGYHLSILRSRKEFLEGEFLYNFLSSELCRSQYYPLANGVTRFGISKTAISNGILFLPPLNEQKEINKYLDDMNKFIKETIDNVKFQIIKLKEYRQSLIYEAVTGKIDIKKMEKEIVTKEVSSL